MASLRAPTCSCRCVPHAAHVWGTLSPIPVLSHWDSVKESSYFFLCSLLCEEHFANLTWLSCIPRFQGCWAFLLFCFFTLPSKSFMLHWKENEDNFYCSSLHLMTWFSFILFSSHAVQWILSGCDAEMQLRNNTLNISKLCILHIFNRLASWKSTRLHSSVSVQAFLAKMNTGSDNEKFAVLQICWCLNTEIWRLPENWQVPSQCMLLLLERSLHYGKFEFRVRGNEAEKNAAYCSQRCCNMRSNSDNVDFINTELSAVAS